MKGHSLLRAKDVFERSNGAFNSSSFGVEVGPFRRTAQDARIEAKVSIRVDVNAAPVFRFGAGLLTVAAKGTALN